MNGRQRAIRGDVLIPRGFRHLKRLVLLEASRRASTADPDGRALLRDCTLGLGVHRLSDVWASIHRSGSQPFTKLAGKTCYWVTKSRLGRACR